MPIARFCAGLAIPRVASRRDAIPGSGRRPGGPVLRAARGGTRAGGAGDDPWGRWLLERLRAEGVDTRAFTLAPGRETPIAFATVTAQGERSFAIVAEGVALAAAAEAGARATETWGATA